MFFFVKQKTAYEMRISDCSSDVCSSDLVEHHLALIELAALDELQVQRLAEAAVDGFGVVIIIVADIAGAEIARRQEVEIMVVRDAIGKGRENGRASCRESVCQYV